MARDRLSSYCPRKFITPGERERFAGMEGVMVVKRRVGLLLATAAVFAAGSASAQAAQQADLDKVEQMQRRMQQLQDQMKQQTQQLQDQMKQVNKELADAKKKAAEVKAAESKSEIPPAFNGAYGADLRPSPTKAE